MHRFLVSCLISAVAAVDLQAQSVRVVGPGGYASIPDALAASSPGDIVHVNVASHPGFSVGIGVTIRAITSVVSLGPVTVDVPVGQTVNFVGLPIGGGSLVVSGGRAVFDACALGALMVNDASAHIVNSSVFTVWATNASVTLSGTSIGPGASFLVGYPTVRLVSSKFHFGGGHIGTGFPGQFSTVPILEASAGSVAWLTNCSLGTVQGGVCPLQVSADSIVRLSGGAIQAGPSGCATAVPGAMLFARSTTPLYVGQNFEINFRTEPNSFVLVFASPFLGETSFGLLLEQPSWLDDQYSFAATLLVADAVGGANVTYPIPGGPGIADQSLWFKGISGLSLPLQASVPVGGIAR